LGGDDWGGGPAGGKERARVGRRGEDRVHGSRVSGRECE
jgi:hypothetical protein